MDDLYNSISYETYNEEYNHYENILDEEITQEDAWVIINKYFETKGLVRQQLDSFDEFLQNSIQELIDDAGEIKIIPEDQFLSDKQVDKVNFFIFFSSSFIDLFIYFYLFINSPIYLLTN